MKRSKTDKTIPAYCLHKRPAGQRGRDRAYVKLSGERVYLGVYDSRESRQRYEQVIAEWEASHRRRPVPPDDLTVAELINRYWDYVEEYYRHPDGTPTGTQRNIRDALRPLRELYGTKNVCDFGPHGLKALRQTLVDKGLSRNYINGCIDRMRRVFKWGVGEELVEPQVYQKLKAVEGLKAGRSAARETAPVKPVADKYVEAIRPFVSRQIWSMIQIQLLTGARSTEVCTMRAIDLDMSSAVWEYRPPAHKTSHHGHCRVIYLGPRAQGVVRPFLKDRAVTAYLFSPAEAITEHRAARHARRSTKLSYGNRVGTNRVPDPKRTPRNRYDKNTYAAAIRKACRKAHVPHWHPHQLRHSAATSLRREFGLETAKAVLGHRVLTATQVYAEADKEKALTAIKQVG